MHRSSGATLFRGCVAGPTHESKAGQNSMLGELPRKIEFVDRKRCRKCSGKRSVGDRGRKPVPSAKDRDQRGDREHKQCEDCGGSAPKRLGVQESQHLAPYDKANRHHVHARAHLQTRLAATYSNSGLTDLLSAKPKVINLLMALNCLNSRCRLRRSTKKHDRAKDVCGDECAVGHRGGNPVPRTENRHHRCNGKNEDRKECRWCPPD